MYKESYDYNTPFKQVDINKILKETPLLENLVIESEPNKRNPVKKEKIDNLRDQLKYIPEQYQWFYRNIIADHDADEEN